MRLWWLWVWCGCWSAEPLDHGVTAEQWVRLHGELALPAITSQCTLANCDGAAALAQALFFEPALSGSKAISCKTCHDPARWFIDTRTPNDVSQTASGFTRRNSPSLVDLGYKPPAQVFTWIGKYASAGAVLELAVHNAMASDEATVASVIRSSSAYNAAYTALFGPPALEDVAIFKNLELSYDAYLERLISVDSPFDQWLAGDPAALDEDAQRGFAVFVGKGGCIDCHRGPMFSDFEYRNTGVPRTAINTGVDNGRFELTNDPKDLGMFVTPGLRQVAQTGPYMHDGSLATLGEVVAFYRRGGDPGGPGTRDPRIV
ncbi:MAG: cytochrome c peroxidase, partial [Kofleriaceae bacterium]